MGINGINSSAASWAQFVKLTQAARERNGGLTLEGAQAANAVSFKKAADVYSGKQTAPVQSVQASSPVTNEIIRKTVGGLFDAYA